MCLSAHLHEQTKAERMARLDVALMMLDFAEQDCEYAHIRGPLIEAMRAIRPQLTKTDMAEVDRISRRWKHAAWPGAGESERSLEAL